jgi:eukaryotic-like serine/threonine-protein kinase
LDYVYCMRKLGLIAAIIGLGTLGSGLLLRMVANLGTWLWLPGIVLLCGGSALLLWCRFAASAAARPLPKIPRPLGTDTARLLDNFEQRFAELKGRKPNATVLGDLYTLGSQLEQRGRAPQATAVYRHLARLDNTYRDVAARLRRLMDAERAKPKAAPPAPDKTTASPAPAAQAASSNSVAAPAVPEAERLGRYQLEREIGRGAMGVVYLGRDTAINRMVAIKAACQRIQRRRTRRGPIALLSRSGNRRSPQSSEHRDNL